MSLTPEHASLDPELLEQATQIVINGLTATYNVHETLGPDGVEAKLQNRFGETALAADVNAEAVLIDALHTMGRPVLVHSEEHGIFEINTGLAGQRLLAVMDGLDGSSVYQKERGTGRYGTMFALFENDNPNYADYVAAGIMLHSQATLLLAVRGQSLRAINLKSSETSYPRTDKQARLVPGAVVFTEKATAPEGSSLYDYFRLNTALAERIETGAGLQTRRSGSTAGNVSAVALGEAAMDVSATRKGNLEFATAFPVVTAAGGVVETIDGEDLGDKSFLDFGQRTHVPVIVAANRAVADQAHKLLAA